MKKLNVVEKFNVVEKLNDLLDSSKLVSKETGVEMCKGKNRYNIIRDLKRDLEVIVGKLDVVEKLNDLLNSSKIVSKETGVEMFDISMMLHEDLCDETCELIEQISDFDFDVNWMYTNLIDEIDELIDIKNGKEKEGIDFVDHLLKKYNLNDMRKDFVDELINKLK